jgi:diguanylate cyclase
MGAFALVTATTAAAALGALPLRRTLATTQAQLREARVQLDEAQVQLGQARACASRDALTGLVNRRGLEARAADLLASGSPWALIFVDLDDFKPVNDAYGHAAGDVVLVEVARRLLEVADGEYDVVGRFGGDEFVLAVNCPFGPIAAMLARDVVAMVREPITIGAGRQVTVSVSVGWVQVNPVDDVREAMRAADIALYRAKAAGGNTVVEYGPLEPQPSVDERPPARTRDAHPHRIPSESGVVIAR